MDWRAWLLIAASIPALLVEAAARPSCASKSIEDIRIVLDAGHTATDSGATSARGVREYVFNLNLAKHVEAGLVKAGYRSTYLMVTQENGTRGLLRRAKHANRMSADIFISIHHDSVADPYLERWLYQGEERLYSDRSKGFSLHVSPRNRKYGESLRFAEVLAGVLIGKGLAPTTNPELCMPEGAKALEPALGIYQRRHLAVLDYTKTTAVLLEAAMIVNRDEELVASSESRQELVAAAIADSVGQFCGVNKIALGAKGTE